MVRLVEEARNAARQRVAQLSPKSHPGCSGIVSASTSMSTWPLDMVAPLQVLSLQPQQLVPVMGEFPPLASQEEFFRTGAQGKGNRGSQTVRPGVCGGKTLNRTLDLPENGADVPPAVMASRIVASRGRGGRVKGLDQGGRGGGRRGRVARTHGPGWIAPTILSNRTSPISLRPRCAPIGRGGVNVDNTEDIVDLSMTNEPLGLEEDDSLQGYHTPPRQQPWAPASEQQVETLHQPGNNLCRFSVLEFWCWIFGVRVKKWF